jgi:hypothetical protein
LSKQVEVFPVAIDSGVPTPLNQHLDHRAETLLTNSSLQHGNWGLKYVIGVGKKRKNLLSRTETRLELGDMKDMVNSASCRQFQFICHLAHACQNWERPKELER